MSFFFLNSRQNYEQTNRLHCLSVTCSLFAVIEQLVTTVFNNKLFNKLQTRTKKFDVRSTFLETQSYVKIVTNVPSPSNYCHRLYNSGESWKYEIRKKKETNVILDELGRGGRSRGYSASFIPLFARLTQFALGYGDRDAVEAEAGFPRKRHDGEIVVCLFACLHSHSVECYVFRIIEEECLLRQWT